MASLINTSSTVLSKAPVVPAPEAIPVNAPVLEL